MPGRAHFDEPNQVQGQSDLATANQKLRGNNNNNGGRSSSDVSDRNVHGTTNNNAKMEKLGTNDKYEITEDDCYDQLGYSWPTWKKWYVLTVIFWVQVSMNFNTALYSNAITGISEEFNVSLQAARCGAMIFLVFYAFGCELWAPWSEEIGRWPILQASLALVNIWQLPVALAKNFPTILVGRALGGLSTAGGSVTLGMVADLWESDAQQYAVAYVVFSSVGGSVLGPIVGGFVEQYCHWRWAIWIQLIFGGVIQIIHFFTVPETRTTIMMDRIAKKRRANGENIWGPNELVPYSERFEMKEVLHTWFRPFRMFITEPIVLVLSLLSGFSDALIFMFIQSFGLVYKQWVSLPLRLVSLSALSVLVTFWPGSFSSLPSSATRKSVLRSLMMSVPNMNLVSGSCCSLLPACPLVSSVSPGPFRVPPSTGLVP